jgi:hypothetical protein
MGESVATAEREREKERERERKRERAVAPQTVASGDRGPVGARKCAVIGLQL